MNELDFPRVLRADAPLPDAERLAPQRDLLLAAVREDTHGRRSAPAARWRPPRRMVLAAAATAGALAVTGGIVATLPDRTAVPPRHTAAHDAVGRQVLSADASAARLELAADTVEKLGTKEPGPKQWVYEKGTGFEGGKPSTSESWTRWDGTGSAQLPGRPSPEHPTGDPHRMDVWYGPNQEAKWKKEGYDDRSQRQFYRFLAALPSDPDAMMRAILAKHDIGDIKGETKAQRDWREVDVLYRSILIPPNAQAGLFRALGKIPGARVVQGIKDPIGRPAIGVTVHYATPTASGHYGTQELFFDPHTYAYLAEIQGVAPLERAPNGKMAPSLTGKSVITTVRDAWGVVDKPGERP